jgi:hypothetical protein
MLTGANFLELQQSTPTFSILNFPNNDLFGANRTVLIPTLTENDKITDVNLFF